MFNFADYVTFLEEGIWNWFSIPMILFLGLFLSLQSRFIQLRRFPFVIKLFFDLVMSGKEGKGVHPIRAFFASVGGCVGVGNIVAICTAIQVGGPGSLFWIWVTAILGMSVKYAEVFLGIRFRVVSEGGYSGGPQYFLKEVFKTPWIPMTAAWLLCLYGIEVYQFNVVTKHLAYNFDLPELVVVIAFLGLILWTCLGGVNRVGQISSWIIPLFVVLYIGMGWFVFFQNRDRLFDVVKDVFYYAFTPYGALGGVVGSSIMMTMAQGVKRGCYTGDLGVGYASVIQSETSLHRPEIQASLAFVDLFLDTFLICTTSVMLILVTGVWQSPLEASLLVQTALSQYFPYMSYFTSFFLFLLGYSTINAYFVSGLKCAHYLSPKWGKKVFIIVGALSFFLFSFYNAAVAQGVMTIFGGALLILNGIGIYALRDKIEYVALEERLSSLPSDVQESTVD